MATETNGTHLAADPDNGPVAWLADKAKNGVAHDAEEPFALAPVVDRIAHSIAKGLAVALKELERHIAGETRKVGDAVDRRFDTLQANFNEVARFVEEQRSANIAVQDQLRSLGAETAGLRETGVRHAAELERLGTEAREFSTSVSARIESTAASLRESDARQMSELETLRGETRDRSMSTAQRIEETARRIDDLCKDLGVYQEDLASIKPPLAGLVAQVDALVVRMDRQADAFRSMHAANSQREMELEQVMDGLARLRSHKASLPANGL